MLFLLTRPIADQSLAFNLFRYLTFRSGAACMTALVLSLLFGAPLIRWLKSVQGSGQPIRPDGPERHVLEKQGTPTMGGVLILASMVVSTLLWVDLRNLYVWVVMALTLGYGALGLRDPNAARLARAMLVGHTAFGAGIGLWTALLSRDPRSRIG